MKTCRTFLLAFFVLIVAPSNYIYADTVIKKDGTHLTGKVIDLNEDHLIVVIEGGEQVVIPLNNVKSVDYQLGTERDEAREKENEGARPTKKGREIPLIKGIVEADPSMVEGCKFIALVTGTSQWRVYEDAKKDVFEQANKNGSTHVILFSPVGLQWGERMLLNAKTYNCNQQSETPAKTNNVLSGKLEMIKKAFDDGIITEDEYKAKRMQIIRDY